MRFWRRPASTAAASFHLCAGGLSHRKAGAGLVGLAYADCALERFLLAAAVPQQELQVHADGVRLHAAPERRPGHAWQVILSGTTLVIVPSIVIYLFMRPSKRRAPPPAPSKADLFRIVMEDTFMKRYEPAPGFSIPCAAMGCMRIADMDVRSLEALIMTALEGGVDFFDHADFYGNHQSEVRFGEVLAANPNLRDRMIVQSKCGIRTGFYDSSYEHIVASAENSLRKLHTDHLDALLIHRPDALAEPEEIARAFRDLKESGKVRYFGVSNHNPMQMEVLQQAVGERLLFNQMQMSVVHTGMIDQGINVNTTFPGLG